MNYIELIVLILVSGIIFSLAFDSLSSTLIHMQGILKLNSSTLKEFHILNYIQQDYIKHGITNPGIKLSKDAHKFYFSFSESVDGEIKRIVYRSIPSGKSGNKIGYIITRDTLSENNFQLLNRRIFVLDNYVKFSLTEDNKFVVLSGPTYGDVLLPTTLPNVVIKGIMVRKLPKIAQEKE
ncbi:MAG: hypothetical protein ACK4R7_03645 [Fervidobacterium sp.]